MNGFGNDRARAGALLSWAAGPSSFPGFRAAKAIEAINVNAKQAADQRVGMVLISAARL
jgi:hypothetical protein